MLYGHFEDEQSLFLVDSAHSIPLPMQSSINDVYKC